MISEQQVLPQSQQLDAKRAVVSVQPLCPECLEPLERPFGTVTHRFYLQHGIAVVCCYCKTHVWARFLEEQA